MNRNRRWNTIRDSKTPEVAPKPPKEVNAPYSADVIAKAWVTEGPKYSSKLPTRNNPTLVLGNENDEVLATIFRGLLSKKDGWSLQKVVLPASGRVGWKFYISGAVTMDSKGADAILNSVEVILDEHGNPW